MTVTLSPLGDLLAVEHWSTRVTVALSPDMAPMDMRRTLLTPMLSIFDNTLKVLHRHVTPERYLKGAPTMVQVGARDAELVFDVPVPGRPDTDAPIAVTLPPVNYEITGNKRPSMKRVNVVPPVRYRHVPRAVMDDVERVVVIAKTHFNLIEAGQQGLSLRAASADYREDVVVTHDGRSGGMLWWAGAASVAGARVPSPQRYSGRFGKHGDLVLTPETKQVR